MLTYATDPVLYNYGLRVGRNSSAFIKAAFSGIARFLLAMRLELIGLSTVQGHIESSTDIIF